MPFPDEAWCIWAIEQLNADSDAAAAASGWSGDFGIVVRGSGEEGEEIGFYVGSPCEGRLPAPRRLPVAELEALAPKYFASASEADWRSLIAGALDPIAALVQRRLVAKGDLGQVVARLQFRGLFDRWLAAIQQGL